MCTYGIIVIGGSNHVKHTLQAQMDRRPVVVSMRKKACAEKNPRGGKRQFLVKAERAEGERSEILGKMADDPE